MKREEALALLKELMIACETMQLAPIVSLKLNNSKNGRWEVRVKWSSNEEKGCFDKVVFERGVTAIEADDGYTIFYRP